MAVPELHDMAERSGVFDAISAVWPVDANVTGAGEPERVEPLVTSPNYFSNAHSSGDCATLRVTNRWE